MKYKHLFFDLDHTLWDFDANARDTLLQLHSELALAGRGVTDFDAFYKTYLLHNEALWAKYRAGQIKQDELRFKRMWLTLLQFKVADEALARQMGALFLERLPNRTLLFPGTIEVLQYLAGKGYQLHLITNGFEEVQHAKLRNSGLSPYFKVVVTSEGSNSLKPHPEIFEYALHKTGATVTESLMIGDTQEADVAGALGVGMDAVHANFIGAAQIIKPTYTITNLAELKGFL